MPSLLHHASPVGREDLYLAAIIGVLIAAMVTGDVGNKDGGDMFAADKAWWYITLLTIGYLVSRSLATSGRHTRDDDTAPTNRRKPRETLTCRTATSKAARRVCIPISDASGDHHELGSRLP